MTTIMDTTVNIRVTVAVVQVVPQFGFSFPTL
jgi:hypothetical protein